MYKCPDIFIDSSYLSYFSIFSSWKWYKNEFIYDDNDYRLKGDFDPMTDKEFEKHLERKFIGSVFGVLNYVIPLIDRSKILYVLDCSKKDIWRNHYYPSYKMHRYDKQLEFDISPGFDYLIKYLIPILCEKHNSKTIRVDNSEADDIIGHIILEKHNQTQETDNVIVASDRDISQLCPYAKMYDLFKTEITIETSYISDKTESLIEDKEDVSTFLLYKALKGDNSDKINGFRPRTGPKTAAKLINNKDELKKICNNDNEAFRVLKNNLKIMDFKRMPERIKQDIWREWEKINENI